MSFRKDLIKMLEEFADLMEFKGENRFKVNAFKNGANTIRRYPGNLEEAVQDGSIKDVKGIGKGILSFIQEFLDTGSVSEYEELKSEIPQGVLDILTIRGLGAKKVKILYESLGIDDAIKLEAACRNDDVANLKGFGEKTQEKIINELDRIKKESGYIHLSRALRIDNEISDKLNDSKSIKNWSVSGDLRRRNEIIPEIIYVVKSDDIEEISKLFEEAEVNKNIITVTNYAVPVQIYVTKTDEDFTATLFNTTGSQAFIDKLDNTETAKSEEEIFKSAGLNFVIPEMREEYYFEHKPENSDLELNAFKGLLHFHTVWSDGVNTLEEMRAEAENTGFEYMAVCDHSKSAYYANGLNPERVLKQKEEIETLNSKGGIYIFHGIESDILNSGDLDYDEDILSQFEFIVASIHSNFGMEEDEMTARIIKAVENPYTDLLAHPTGRLLLSRKGYKLNIKKIIDACAANDTAIEINANPHRLDLDWRNLDYAREKGVKISINPDAHSTEGISDINYGISIARKGGIKTDTVINCYNKESFIKYINRKVVKFKN